MLAKSIAGAMCKASLIAAVPLLLLSACTDDISGSVDAYVAKGPVTGATCNLYRADTNELLAGAATSSDGFASFGNVAFAGVGYVSCTGGTYTDEATGSSKNLSGTLRSGKRFSGSTTFVVTPLTEIAMTKAEAAGGVEANIESFNNSVANEFGLGAVAITEIIPADLNTSVAQDDPAGWYGTVLAAISQYELDNNFVDGTPINLVLALLTEVSTIETGSFPAALANLISNSNISGNVNADVVNAVTAGLGSNPSGTPGEPSSSSSSSSTSSSSTSSGNPTVTTVSPETGSEAGGTSLTITGTGFDGSTVTVGGSAATGVSVDSATQITAVTPGGEVTGSAVDVVVTNGDGQTVTAEGAFTYTNACEDCNLDVDGCPF